MIPTVSVLGVLGLCWVGFGKPTQVRAPSSVAWRACVLGVLGLRARARRCTFFNSHSDGKKKSYASLNKPNTPNTLNSHSLNPLNSLAFECVGFVLALPVGVLGSKREAGDDE
ncbi:hypothetical protein D3C76_1410540 [compost metagenome]